MKTLVAFYSRADENFVKGELEDVEIGNTERAAKEIANIIGGADTFKIEQKYPYAKDYHTCIEQVERDIEKNARPELLHMLPNLDEYDEIFLGYPNYLSKMPMAVYTFLEAYDFTGKTIHPFMTHEGSGLCDTEKEIERVAKGAKVAVGLSISGSTVRFAEDLIRRWIEITYKKA